MLPLKCAHGIRGMLQLALIHEGNSEAFTKACDLADTLRVPRPLFSKILYRLAEAGLVESRKGPSGGVRLARRPADTSILAIIEALDATAFKSCVMGFPECSGKSPCPLHAFWAKHRRVLLDRLAATSLSDWQSGKHQTMLSLKQPSAKTSK